MFVLKEEEVTGGWRKLHNEQLHDLYRSSNMEFIGQGGVGVDWIIMAGDRQVADWNTVMKIGFHTRQGIC